MPRFKVNRGILSLFSHYLLSTYEQNGSIRIVPLLSLADNLAILN